MANTIWKFQVDPLMVNVLEAPLGSRIVSAGLDPKGDLCVWAEVNPDLENHSLLAWVEGTGQPLLRPESARFVGTVLDGQFVWHVYTEGSA